MISVLNRRRAKVDLELLERLAREATPGPWMTPEHRLSVHKVEAPCTAVAFTMTKSGSCDNHAANAAFIAAANPAVVLALIEVAQKALAEVADADNRCKAKRSGEWGKSEKEHCEAYTGRGRDMCVGCPRDEVSDALRSALEGLSAVGGEDNGG